MTIRRPHLLLSSLIALTVTFAGCASTEVASTPANVVAAASSNAELSTFAKLIKQAGLESTLEGAGPVTVFAPSDEAFKAMPAAALDKLAKDPAQLKAVLNYHVLPGLMKAADVEGSKQIATVNGAKATVSKAGDFVTIDDALVTKADIATGNGVIHVIDRLLTPPKK
ncbi:fasciclin domain-containing protein [Aquabacterium sp.]|uniref:fasciclin domain-containing protein n=1 Tax=Aquabacterium sp. TaxID=1872578 RepID=UPI002E2F1BB7|nr:fasciclin domain-containing protein [Aquabacterium sp.]HEX5312311.1 fasciclin domain-containing protein [Aquabacterium sp.]